LDSWQRNGKAAALGLKNNMNCSNSDPAPPPTKVWLGETAKCATRERKESNEKRAAQLAALYFKNTT
jgi:hypothetical protein